MDEARQVESFRALLSKCLTVTSSDALLVIYDESMQEFLAAAESAAESESVSTTFIYLPKKYQRFLTRDSLSRGSRDKIDLPSGVVAAISASTVIANVLDSTPDNAPVRKAVNHTPRPNNCRLATIPGISQAILEAIVEAPVDEILAACEEIAWAIGQATEAEITSFGSSGETFRLKFGLGDWENEPIMSPGILLPGSWGNVPPGETFCCPPASTVNGAICINGSVRGHVLKDGEEVLLEFESGKLVSWKPINEQVGSPALRFFDSLQMRCRANNDDNWNTFAELGIGLNPKIAELTGNPLFDEKACQTVHIAVGDNSVFGDDVSSSIHEDLVVRRPSLRLNDHVVMERGIVDHALISRLRAESAELRTDLTFGDVVIYLREGRVGQHRGTLMRRLRKAQRVNYVRMAPDALSATLNELCESLRAYDRVHIATFLRAYPSFSGIPTVRLLNFLHHYRVLGIAPAAGIRARRASETVGGNTWKPLST